MKGGQRKKNFTANIIGKKYRNLCVCVTYRRRGVSKHDARGGFRVNQQWSQGIGVAGQQQLGHILTQSAHTKNHIWELDLKILTEVTT